MVVFAYLFFTLPVMIQVVMSLLASVGLLFILYVINDFWDLAWWFLRVVLVYLNCVVSGWEYYVEYYIYAFWSQRWVSCKRWSCCEFFFSIDYLIHLAWKIKIMFCCLVLRRKSGVRRETSSRRRWAGVWGSLKKCYEQLRAFCISDDISMEFHQSCVMFPYLKTLQNCPDTTWFTSSFFCCVRNPDRSEKCCWILGKTGYHNDKNTFIR